MNEIECETCIKRKTVYCPNHVDCYDTINKPYYQNRIMLLEENKQLKERLQQKEDIINKAYSKIEKMFDIGDENKVIDDLLETQKILDNKGE